MADEHPHAGPGEEHREAQSLPVIEEPLDPAQQSLADALRASFWVLKLVMIVVVVFFLCSNVFIVDEKKEEVAVLRFGDLVDIHDRGLHFAWPFPIDEKIRVGTAPKTMMIDTFWMNIREEDKTKDLSELAPRGQGLDPAVDGALLTGDRAIMHLLLHVRYRVRHTRDFVKNVLVSGEQDETRLVRVVVQNAAVAAAARAEADLLWKDPRPVVAAIRTRAQETLDHMAAGIALDQVTADKSYYPLQVMGAVLDVSQAEQKREAVIQQALTKRQEILNEAAGQAWAILNEEIQKIDQLPAGAEQEVTIANMKQILANEAVAEASEGIETPDQPAARSEREATMERIGHILANEAAGKARELIKQAENQRNKIKQDTLARAHKFEALQGEYQRNRELLRQRLATDMLIELYSQPKVIKWFLTPDTDTISVWLSKDPKETREAQRDRATNVAEGE